MKFNSLPCFFLLLFIRPTFSFVDPFTISAVIGAAAISGLLGGGLVVLKCKFQECCDADHGWLPLDFDGLERDLDDYLYGQHLAKHSIITNLKNHMLDESPQKPLVMSFHGPTGTGKNYVSKMIAKRMYKEGLESKFFKLWIGKLHFQLISRTERYTQELRDTIRENIRNCPRSLFIIDEMDSVVPGVIEGLKPFLDHHHMVDGVDPRKATFIFLSNTGSENITSLAFEFKLTDRKREDITMKDMRPLIQNGAFNEKGGLQRASIIKNQLIDVYVPFLPLERIHVEHCIEFYFKQKQCPYDQDLIEEIAKELNYIPARYEYFSQGGCKLLESTIRQKFSHSCIRNKMLN